RHSDDDPSQNNQTQTPTIQPLNNSTRSPIPKATTSKGGAGFRFDLGTHNNQASVMEGTSGNSQNSAVMLDLSQYYGRRREAANLRNESEGARANKRIAVPGPSRATFDKASPCLVEREKAAIDRECAARERLITGSIKQKKGHAELMEARQELKSVQDAHSAWKSKHEQERQKMEADLKSRLQVNDATEVQLTGQILQYEEEICQLRRVNSDLNKRVHDLVTNFERDLTRKVEEIVAKKVQPSGPSVDEALRKVNEVMSAAARGANDVTHHMVYIRNITVVLLVFIVYMNLMFDVFALLAEP
ncbi:hypothetical protein Hypma_005514, partial [Hypsizygus marmoreus]